jgi:hypothetical protein
MRPGTGAVVIVSNNAAWGIARYHEDCDSCGRLCGAKPRQTDCATMARARVTWHARSGPSQSCRRGLANAPVVIALEDCPWGLSSDRRKGLGCRPTDKALAAWGDAERNRRGMV